MGPQANQALQQFLQPYDEEQFQGLFQQAFVDPAMRTYEQQALPAIQQRFVDANAGSSSALNQALGQSAADLSTMLGGQMGQFYQQQQGNQMNALGVLNQLLGQRSFEPIIQQKQGLGGSLLGAAGSIGGGFLGGPAGAMMGASMFGGGGPSLQPTQAPSPANASRSWMSTQPR